MGTFAVVGLWAALVLAALATLATLWFLVLLIRTFLRDLRNYHRDRYRRAFRQGKFEIRCDYMTECGPCDRFAHWMLIRPDIPWGKGEKRCWRHHRRSAYMLGHDGQSVYMPVNRRTAWVDDPPPNLREETDV